MERAKVAQAVEVLRQQGHPVSVRRVHAQTGGSFRDIARLLRELGVTAAGRSPVPAAVQTQRLQQRIAAIEAALARFTRQAQPLATQDEHQRVWQHVQDLEQQRAALQADLAAWQAARARHARRAQQQAALDALDAQLATLGQALAPVEAVGQAVRVALQTVCEVVGGELSTLLERHLEAAVRHAVGFPSPDSTMTFDYLRQQLRQACPGDQPSVRSGPHSVVPTVCVVNPKDPTGATAVSINAEDVDPQHTLWAVREPLGSFPP